MKNKRNRVIIKANFDIRQVQCLNNNESEDIIKASMSVSDIKETDVIMMQPLMWAYIGDAVYEIYIRNHIIGKGLKNTNELHVASIKYVKARHQARFLEELLPFLSDEERDIVRRGRNTKTGHVPKNSNIIEYRYATALEALIGYLYLLKRDGRIDEIMKKILEFGEEAQSTDNK